MLAVPLSASCFTLQKMPIVSGLVGLGRNVSPTNPLSVPPKV